MSIVEQMRARLQEHGAYFEETDDKLIEGGLAEIERLLAANGDLANIIGKLEAENKELKARLGGKWVPWDERIASLKSE